MVEHQSTLRKLEAKFHIPKTTLHNQFMKRLKEDDYEVFEKVKALLEKNKAERSLRGGNATRRKFSKV
jgi:putative DeoR family transcriptional regulator (stage III sporulation protein D)